MLTVFNSVRTKTIMFDWWWSALGWPLCNGYFGKQRQNSFQLSEDESLTPRYWTNPLRGGIRKPCWADQPSYCKAERNRIMGRFLQVFFLTSYLFFASRLVHRAFHQSTSLAPPSDVAKTGTMLQKCGCTVGIHKYIYIDIDHLLM